MQKLPKTSVPEQPPQDEDDEYLSGRARRFLLASSLIRDACVSRLEIHYKTDLVSVKSYERFYSKWGVGLYYFFMILNLLTILIEHPSSIFVGKNRTPPPYQIALAINLMCELYFYYRWYVISSISEKGAQKSSQFGKFNLAILILMSVDAVIYIICNHIPNQRPVRWSRFLRPILLLTFPENRRLRAAFDNLRNTARDVLPVFCLIVSVLLLVSIIAMTGLKGKVLFNPDGRPYFTRFLDVAWEMYILTTTANSPDVIIPAYEENRLYISLYLFVSGICNWLFLGILTASIYNSYKSHLGASVLNAVADRKYRLDEAFQLVATHTPTGEKGITLGTFMRLMRIAKPGRSSDSLRVIFHILNKSRTDYLNAVEFSRVAEYIRIHLEEIELSRHYFEQYLPRFYDIFMSPTFQKFKRIYEHRMTSLFFISLIVANGFTAVLLRRYDTIQSAMEWFFTIIFLFELACTYLASGGVRFFADGWNKFDCVIVFGALLGQVVQTTMNGFGVQLSGGMIQLLLLLRLCRLLKIFSVVKSFKVVVDCVVAILPSLTAYAAILLIIYYVYACIGMEVFSGLYKAPSRTNYTKGTNCGEDRLAGTEFANLHYCLFNFNSATESYIMLFTITVGNNWHILVHGINRVTNIWTRLFFLLIHWTCVLLVLNVVLAFIIEAFLIEYDAQTTKFDQYVQERLRELEMDATIELEKRGIKNYGQPRFFITRELLERAFPPNSPINKAFLLQADNTSIEVLMFRMFESEVEEMLAGHSTQDQKLRYKTRDTHAQL